ncbi:hypothetical protein MYX82_09445, partial [Acidobacteria bacterium AH-259-D05]|nr:hypothetical protein [Acidobacteria bacterium AH-259-D05]
TAVSKLVSFLILVALMVLDAALLFGQIPGLPAPREPNYPEITSVEQLLPNARIIVQRERDPFRHNPPRGIIGIGLKKNEKALIFANNSWDDLVIEALHIAMKETGAQVDLIRLDQGRRLVTSPAETMRGRSMSSTLPLWIRDAFTNYDVVVGYFQRGSTWGKLGSTRTVSWEYPTKEQLYSAHASFPDEVMYALANKVWRKLINGTTIRITDPTGTDVTFTIDDKFKRDMAKIRGLANRGKEGLENPLPHENHLTLIPDLSAKPDAHGVIITRALHAGPIPEMKLYLENGQVVRVEGGGAAGEYFKEAFLRFDNIQYQNRRYPGYPPGPGVRWLEEVSLGINPKAVRPYNEEQYREMGGYTQYSFGRRRSGVLHFAIGSDMVDRATEPEDRIGGLPRNHRDLELYFVTYYVDGEKIVENGHLLALDDREIRRIAAKYGDPDQLLSEDWIPAVPGVNVPAE